MGRGLGAYTHVADYPSLYAHGIAFECHAQNIILVLENELPKRIILKDLHDGVRYVPDQLLHPERAPKLHPELETHRKFNRYSFIYAGMCLRYAIIHTMRSFYLHDGYRIVARAIWFVGRRLLAAVCRSDCGLSTATSRIYRAIWNV